MSKHFNKQFKLDAVQYYHTRKMMEAIYEEVSAKTEKATVQHRHISVCEMLEYLDVSRSGYRF